MFDCVASQPIFNTKTEIFGYELLYRAGSDSTSFDALDPDKATKDVLVTAFSDIGIEEITGGKKAFVNFTADLVLDEVPFMLSNNILIVELLENIAPTAEVLKACGKLKEKGYLIALDDFVYSEAYEPLLDLADIVKIDFLSTDKNQIERLIRKVNKGRRKILLAEKVETYEELEFAKSMGFTLFQGFFFCRPKITSSKSIDTLKISKLMLLKYIADPNVSFYDLANVIKRDVVLSYRLLKIVNSAYYGLKYSVTGILHALTILGLDEIRRWVSLIILSEIKTSKPNELIRTALVRGMFMEKLAVQLKKRKQRDEYFMVGLFSLAEAIMDSPMESILKQSHLSPEISAPLSTGQGHLADLLNVVINIEMARWDETRAIADRYGITMRTVSKLYIDSMVGANRLMG